MLRITGGRVYDPANGVDGDVRDVCLDGGSVVADLPDDAPRLDAKGMVVIADDVDIHLAHRGAGGQRGAQDVARGAPRRRRRPHRDHARRDGRPRPVDVHHRLPLRAARLHDGGRRGTPPLTARHTLAELRDTPIVDAAFLVLMGNNLPLFELIREAEGDGTGRVAEAVAWWLKATGGYGVKLVNPGGVEMWKHGNGNVTSLDDEVEGLGVTPRRVLETIATAVDELGLPHPVHVHCNNLGVAGNSSTTLDTLETLQGRRAHFAHLQFHAYGGTPGKRPRSDAPELAAHLDAHPEHSADIGQVMFGPATTMTADAPVSALLRDVTGGKWLNHDLEAETGCGIVPFAYKERNYVHALQWGIGLELFLLTRDPWRVVLSTDHPNGGSFLSYPRLIRLLMDREFRNEQIKRVNQKAIGRTVLRDDIDREYTLGEIHRHPRRARAAARAGRQGPPRGRRGRRRDGLPRARGPRGDVRHAALRHQGRAGDRRGRRAAGDAPRRPAARRARPRRGDRAHPEAAHREALQRPLRELPGARAVAARAGAQLPGRTRRGRPMRLAGAEVVDTFAEAFPMWGSRIVVTAESAKWAAEAGRSLTGFATSVIGCKCEAGVDRELHPDETPDGRPGISALLFAPDREGLVKRLVERIGQSVLTCPTTACFNGLEGEETENIGGQLRFFGDGYQASKVLGGKRFWRVPVMEGEFLIEERFVVAEGVAGGNIIMLGPDVRERAARRRGGGRGDARRPRRDPPLPGRHRPQRQQARLALRRPDRLDERQAVPDAARPGAPRPRSRRTSARCSRSSSTASRSRP